MSNLLPIFIHYEVVKWKRRNVVIGFSNKLFESDMIMLTGRPAGTRVQRSSNYEDGGRSDQECVSEFISFITGEASDKCQREKRKTINGDDLLWAMTTLGFDNYVVPLKDYLRQYRETEVEKNAVARHEDNSSSSSPCNIGGDRITANPSSLQGFTNGNFHDHGSVVIGFGTSDGNSERAWY